MLTVFAWLKQALAPFNIGFPPHALRATARSCFLNEPISPYVVPVGDDHVLLRSCLLFRCTVATECRVQERPGKT
jgi:hypothetical protein